MANLIITIDGPAASGKSTVARLLAKRLGASFLDTGAMYRAVTLAAMRAGVDMSDEEKLLGVLDGNRFGFAIKKGEIPMYIGINGVDVTEQIRSPAVTANARYAASSAKVRAKLAEIQRQFADAPLGVLPEGTPTGAKRREEKIVTEGRDHGTMAFLHR